MLSRQCLGAFALVVAVIGFAFLPRLEKSWRKGWNERFETALAAAKEIYVNSTTCTDEELATILAAKSYSVSRHRYLPHLSYYLASCHERRGDSSFAKQAWGASIGHAVVDRTGFGNNVLVAARLSLVRAYSADVLADREIDWAQLRYDATEAMSAQVDPMRNTVLLAVADHNLGETLVALERLRGLREANWSNASVDEFMLAGVALANVSTWKEAHRVLKRAAKRFPEHPKIPYRHARLAQEVGDGDQNNLTRDVILPKLRKSQELSVRLFREGQKQDGVACMEPALVYDWSDAAVRGVVVNFSWASATGALEVAPTEATASSSAYGSSLARRWQKASPNTFTWDSLHFSERSPFVAKLQGVFVSGVSGVAVFDVACRVYLTAHDEEEPFFDDLPPRQILKYGAMSVKRAILLQQVRGDSPYHILAEMAARLWLLRSVWKGAEDQVELIANPSELLRSVVTGIFGIADPRFLNVSGRLIYAEALHVADWRSTRRGKIMRDTGRLYHFLPPAGILRELRALYHRPSERRDDCLLWLSREGKRRRQLAGEPALLDGARRLWRGGVEVLGDKQLLALPDVRRSFATATAVVGVHGPGLANILFCRVGTHVVEVTCPQVHCHYFAHLSLAIGLEYWYVPWISRTGYLSTHVALAEGELLGVLGEIAALRPVAAELHKEL